MEPSSQIAAAERQRLAARRPVLALRARAMAALHRFFQARDFLHVETPVRLSAPALEDYIDAEASGEAWLRTSPELHMKRLLAAGYERLYQVGPCFRHGERGQRHQPEFAMLEWYRLQADWRDILRDTVALLREVTREVTGGSLCRVRGMAIDVDAPWAEITVDEAFARYADISLDAALSAGRFEEVLVAQVEPRLGLGVPTVLSEYPLACSGLSRPIPGRPDRVERWELYLAGMELGNACSELVDAAPRAAPSTPSTTPSSAPSTSACRRPPASPSAWTAWSWPWPAPRASTRSSPSRFEPGRGGPAWRISLQRTQRWGW